MRRIMVIAASVILILLVVAVLCVLNMDWVVSRILTSKFRSKVTVSEIFFRPMDEIDVRDFKIHNPKYFTKSHNALEVAAINIVAHYPRFFQQVTIIDWIEANDMVLTVDYLNGVTNWEILMKHISSNSNTSPSNSYSIIKELIFNNLIVRIAKGNGNFDVHVLKQLVLYDIKTNSGDLATQLTRAILYQAIFNSQNFVKIPLNTAKDTINQAFDTFDFLNPFSSGK